MNERVLQRKLDRHNLLQIFLGVGWALLAVLLWYVSWWIWRGLIAFGLSTILKQGAWDYSFWAAWICTGILAIEGLRSTRPLFDLHEYHKSIYNDHVFLESRTMIAIHARSGNPLGTAYWVSQFLFCAPRSTLESLIALRSIHRARPDDVKRAADIFMDLAETRQWTPITRYAGDAPAIFLLDHLKMIWTEIEDGELRIRMPAATKVSDYL